MQQPGRRGMSTACSGKAVPIIQQVTAVDCGPACLAMVLAYYGKRISLDELRQALGTYRDGTDARAILSVAANMGLQGRGIRVGIDQLDLLPAASILFWRFNHFVVFERLEKGAVRLVDPAAGVRRVPIEWFWQNFSGVALTFEPDWDFTAIDPKPRKRLRYVNELTQHWRPFALVCLHSIFLRLLALALVFCTGVVVDQVIPRRDHDLLSTLGLGFMLMSIFNFLSSSIRAHLVLDLRTKVDHRITSRFVEHLVALPYSFFHLRPAGDLMVRLNSHAWVREILTGAATAALLDGPLVSLYLVLLFVSSPSIAGLVLVVGALQVAVYLLTRKRQRELMAQSLEANAGAQSYQLEMLTGMETIKSLGVEKQVLDRWHNLFIHTLNAAIARGRLEAWSTALGGTLSLLAPMSILAWGAYEVLEGRITLGTMVAANALAAGFLGPLTVLVSTAMQLQLLGSYLERVNDVMDTPRERNTSAPQRSERLSGHLRLERVHFRYSLDGSSVIDGIDFSITAGQRVAVVGRSGCGKSTLARLLLGLYKPSSGRILFDDISLEELELSSVRLQIGMVTQEPHLFCGTIRENIALGGLGASMARVVEAAKLARVHDDIMSMRMGYETVLADRGRSLSGGQRQRLAIARALARDPAILILDEATSGIDAVTERQIQLELRKLRCTQIHITHHTSTITRADLILVLDEGKLVESGCHEELRSRNGLYARLLGDKTDPVSLTGPGAAH